MMIYTMKTVTINKTKVKIFDEKEDLVERLGLSEKEITLVMEYQRKFPELLQDNKEDFIIDGENLWNQLNNPQGEYSKWFSRKIEPMFEENKDFISVDKLVGKKNKAVIRHILTIDTAKQVSLMSGSDKKSSDKVRDTGKLIRDYFILMETTLRDYEKWETNRGLSKDGWNEMKPQIKLWCERNGYDSTLDIFYMREANMINKALTGFTASELNAYIGSKDNITRNHLSSELNKSIEILESTNTNLLISDLDFEFRKGVIEKVCKNKYSELHIVNNIKQVS